jgi:hypothetical protein
MGGTVTQVLKKALVCVAAGLATAGLVNRKFIDWGGSGLQIAFQKRWQNPCLKGVSIANHPD